MSSKEKVMCRKKRKQTDSCFFEVLPKGQRSKFVKKICIDQLTLYYANITICKKRCKFCIASTVKNVEPTTRYLYWKKKILNSVNNQSKRLDELENFRQIITSLHVTSLCTDVPPPSGKIGRGDVCESLSLIVFRYKFA